MRGCGDSSEPCPLKARSAGGKRDRPSCPRPPNPGKSRDFVDAEIAACVLNNEFLRDGIVLGNEWITLW